MSAAPIPLLARPGNEPDRAAMFRTLLRRWQDQIEPANRLGRPSDRSLSCLADILGVSKQKIGKWNSLGESGPPWWVIMWLCADLGVSVLIEPSGVSIVATPTAPTPAARGS